MKANSASGIRVPRLTGSTGFQVCIRNSNSETQGGVRKDTYKPHTQCIFRIQSSAQLILARPSRYM